MIASCKGNSQQTGNVSEVDKVQVGAESPEMYYPLIRDKRVAVVANQTSMIGSVHLVDSLVHAGMTIKKVFGPEHGFRGNAADGEKVESGFDLKTGIPVVSLYGSHKKPTPEDLADVDIVIFDIQDVGARFYTYISTMSYVMEACAENGMRLIVLDRPNPHGDYVDGPVLEKEYSSFVGLHPVPVVHGMTIGEYARLVNGEGWLKDGIQCDLKVIPCKNYDHLSRYELPVAPSPNLPNNNAIQLYPSLCFFEGTIISIGRGTDYPFQVIGHPDLAIGSFVFTPQSIPGVSEHPPFEGKTCYGQSLIGFIQSVLSKERRLHLNWIISYYSYFKGREAFFTPYFTKLAGTDKLEQQIKEELSEEQIRATWQEDLKKFKIIRKKYLLYPDFE
ncbi:MAG: DUF1343 domain-containing protein [Bacteroidales bacterium]|nr:DUF1343 domain-containing protein [Bacteroidales bacterium]